MLYQILTPELHGTADTVRKFCRDSWGIPSTRLVVEKAINTETGFVPTLHALNDDRHTVCIEVSTRCYSNLFESFVLDCRSRGLAVKLYVAVPQEGPDANFKSDLARARLNGIGVITVSGGTVDIVNDALPQSLAGVRGLDPTDLPPKYRKPVRDAVDQFRRGATVAACTSIYEEVEGVARKIAAVAKRKNLWKKGHSPKLTGTTPLYVVATTLQASFDTQAAKCPELRAPLFSRVAAVTPHRNAADHAPKDSAARVKRDREARTRFETALDLLRDLLDAARPLRI